MERLSGGYKPYTNKQWEKISDLWQIYKNDIGLDGELYMQLKAEGKSEGDIEKEIESHHEAVKENLKIWHELRETSQR